MKQTAPSSSSINASPVDLGKIASTLEGGIDITSTRKLEAFFFMVKSELTKALYLGIGWIFPDGSWRPGSHWGGQSQRRQVLIEEILSDITDSESQDALLNDYFSEGRNYFTDEQFNHIKTLARVFKVLNTSKVYNEKAMSALLEVSKRGKQQLQHLVATNPPLVNNDRSGNYGFQGDNSI